MTGPDGDASPAVQRRAVERAMTHVTALIAAGHRVVLTHGNGPQVGNLLLKNQIAAAVVPPVPLDWCGAQTQATIGVLILNALGPRTAVVVTRTLVDAADPAFRDPVKPIGRYFAEAEARRFQALGETWREFPGRGWRRVVASPRPLEILDAPAALALMAAGYTVVVAGGGGVPVVRRDDGSFTGVEAVVDKDAAASVLARAVEATVLVIATDVPAAVAGFGTPAARPIGRTTAARMRELQAAGHFASGSMGPKVAAALEFAAEGGRAVITSLEHLGEALTGGAGTVVEG
ncbi:carbamate kinase [Sphaerisporangium sp. TRM90804]|uniref:amino acid kinase family protein n=1 Tax=Sphaerisporangium sp. TRM90804 TaxID=3031113 RepID=UPI00244C10E3|nr:carbamate kinase [Sphaerisporangium sp. TRM90804]MDH2424163.1 carbamate kinase [Sphaerisporangium sp. TRM90804]